MSGSLHQYLTRVAIHSNDCYFSIHRKVILGNGKTAIPGHAHKNIDDAARDALYWLAKGCDIYLAQGGEINTKRTRGPSKSPYPAADRTAINVVCCKNLYLDVDVKPDKPEEGYATTEEALEAINNFLVKVGLPNPTFVVSSGTGGFHVYWTFTHTITPTEWQPMANALANAARQYGLKFDSQCTVDATRLLRIAGTQNFKQNPPLPVEIYWDTDIDVDPDELAKVLAFYDNGVRRPTPKSSLDSRTQSPLLNGEIFTDLGAGLKPEYAPADIDEVAKHCPFINETLRTGGINHAEPLWKYTISLASRCEDPTQTAHRLSCNHANYSPAETEAKLGQSQQDRIANPSLGPPGCEAIKYAGAVECAACPYLALRSNPLNVGFKRANGHAFTSPHAVNDDLPPEYYRGKNNLIYKDSEAETDDDGNIIGNSFPICVFPYPILYNSAFAEGHEGRSYRICFDTIEAEDVIKRVELDFDVASDKYALQRELSAQGLICRTSNPMMDFMVSFLRLLRDTKTTLVSVPPVGWYVRDGVMGFAYDGAFYTSHGAHKCHKMPIGGSEYAVVGDEQPWRDLTPIVITPDRPDLCVLVASGFAAPLVALSGQKGFLLGCWSMKSGVYKTTALSLAQTIWGGTSGMQGMTDTLNYVFTKIGIIKNLPLIYDEIKSKKQIAQFVDLTHQLTHGRDKGRALRDGSIRAPREWNTLIAYAVNMPLAQEVQAESKGTDAALFRMFEFQAITPASRSQFSTAMVAGMTHKLETNYGHIGRDYAKFLGENYALVNDKLRAMQEHLQKMLPHEPDQRFWIATIACVITGASFAKALGYADFPIQEMLNFMVKEYHRMRTGRVAISQDYTHHVVAGSELAVFLRAKLPRNTIRTDIVWTQQGRPPKNSIKLLNDSENMRREELHVQISHKPDPVIRIADGALAKYCEEKSIPKLALLEAMRVHYGANMSMGRLGSGTKYATSLPEPIWTIAVKGTPLENELELPD